MGGGGGRAAKRGKGGGSPPPSPLQKCSNSQSPSNSILLTPVAAAPPFLTAGYRSRTIFLTVTKRFYKRPGLFKLHPSPSVQLGHKTTMAVTLRNHSSTSLTSLSGIWRQRRRHRSFDNCSRSCTVLFRHGSVSLDKRGGGLALKWGPGGCPPLPAAFISWCSNRIPPTATAAAPLFCNRRVLLPNPCPKLWPTGITGVLLRLAQGSR